MHTRDGNIRLPVRERRVAQVEQDPVERLPLAAIDGERPCVHERQLRTTDHSGEPRLSGKEKHARPMVWYVGGWSSDVSDLVVVEPCSHRRQPFCSRQRPQARAWEP